MIQSDTEDDEPPMRCAECDELFCDLFESRGADDGSLLCHRCYGDENFAELSRYDDNHVPGQVRRWDFDNEVVVALKPVTYVPADDTAPYCLEDWVPIRPRKRARIPERPTYVQHTPMFVLDTSRHHAGYKNQPITEVVN